MNTITFIMALALVQFGAVKGKVTQVDGITPIKNLRVDAYDSTTKKLIYSKNTDSLGAYVIGNLPTGNYKIRTTDYTSSYVNMYYDNKLYWDSSATVNVFDPDTVPNINIIIPTGGKMKGHVYKADGITPFNGFCFVTAMYCKTGEGAELGFVDTIDGSYKMSGLPTGWYKIQYYPFDMAHNNVDTIYPIEYYNNADTWASAESIYIAAPDSVTGIDAVLDTGGSISGHVYQDDGTTPLSGVSVACWINMNNYYSWGKVAAETTDVNGYYRLSAFRTDNYRVSAIKSGYDTLWYDNKLDSSFANLVPVIMPDNTPNIDFRMNISGVEGTPEEQPKVAILVLKAYPNPFRDNTTINYQLPDKGVASLTVYNVAGELVKVLEKTNSTAGVHQVVWKGVDENGKKVTNGIYICRLSFGKYTTTQKIILIK